MFNIDCHALSFNVWPRPPFIRMKNFDPISSGPVFKYLKGVRFLGLKFRGFFLFRNKIYVNAKIKSRDFFRITATLKFKSSEILNNFYQPQFSILVNHWVKILMREKFSVMIWYCQKTHGKTLDELVVKSCYVIVMYNEITGTSCVVISGWKAYPSLNTPKI